MAAIMKSPMIKVNKLIEKLKSNTYISDYFNDDIDKTHLMDSGIDIFSDTPSNCIKISLLGDEKINTQGNFTYNNQIKMTLFLYYRIDISINIDEIWSENIKNVSNEILKNGYNIVSRRAVYGSDNEYIVRITLEV